MVMLITNTTTGERYSAFNSVQGVLIDPVLPPGFWDKPVEQRTKKQLKRWMHLPFVVSEGFKASVWCLDGGCHDRPSMWGEFESVTAAVAAIKGGLR
jgi:hypothetical protein